MHSFWQQWKSTSLWLSGCLQDRRKINSGSIRIKCRVMMSQRASTSTATKPLRFQIRIAAQIQHFKMKTTSVRASADQSASSGEKKAELQAGFHHDTTISTQEGILVTILYAFFWFLQMKEEEAELQLVETGSCKWPAVAKVAMIDSWGFDAAKSTPERTLMDSGSVGSGYPQPEK